MDARRAAVLVVAKMALSDGLIAEEEREFLAPMLDADETVDGVLAAAKSKSK